MPYPCSPDERGVSILPGNLTAGPITPPSVELLVETSTGAPSVISRVRAIEDSIRSKLPDARRTSTRTNYPCTDHTVDTILPDREVSASATSGPNPGPHVTTSTSESKSVVHFATVMGNGLIDEEPLRNTTRTTSSTCITSGNRRDERRLRGKNKNEKNRVTHNPRSYKPKDGPQGGSPRSKTSATTSIGPPQQQLEIRPERVHGSTREERVTDDAGLVRLPAARRAQQAIDGLREGYPADAHYGLAANDCISIREANASRAIRPQQGASQTNGAQSPDSSTEGLERAEAEGILSNTTKKRSADTALFTEVNTPLQEGKWKRPTRYRPKEIDLQNQGTSNSGTSRTCALDNSEDASTASPTTTTGSTTQGATARNADTTNKPPADTTTLTESGDPLQEGRWKGKKTTHLSTPAQLAAAQGRIRAMCAEVQARGQQQQRTTGSSSSTAAAATATTAAERRAVDDHGHAAATGSRHDARAVRARSRIIDCQSKSSSTTAVLEEIRTIDKQGDHSSRGNIDTAVSEVPRVHGVLGVTSTGTIIDKSTGTAGIAGLDTYIKTDTIDKPGDYNVSNGGAPQILNMINTTINTTRPEAHNARDDWIPGASGVHNDRDGEPHALKPHDRGEITRRGSNHEHVSPGDRNNLKGQVDHRRNRGSQSRTSGAKSGGRARGGHARRVKIHMINNNNEVAAQEAKRHNAEMRAAHGNGSAITDASKWQPVEEMMINNDERRRREFIFETARGGGDRRRILGSVSIHVTGLTYTDNMRNTHEKHRVQPFHQEDGLHARRPPRLLHGPPLPRGPPTFRQQAPRGMHPDGTTTPSGSTGGINHIVKPP
jgi:hypothetical protein